MQEQKFWSSYHSTMKVTDQQLDNEEVVAALEYLKKHGRLHATINFDG